MEQNMPSPTPHPEVNALLAVLLERMQALLGERLVGLYLEGSLANGDFDADSDIDFVAALTEEVDEARFTALQSMHDEIQQLETPWAIQLEGSYLSLPALRQHDPALVRHPNIERGWGERLKMVAHDANWDIHRHILYERGITLLGPPPETLVTPVSPGQLRQAALDILTSWAAAILADPSRVRQRGYQSYIVLSLCRILYTLEHGTIASKRTAAQWAQHSLGPSQAGLIQHAWEGRSHPDEALGPGDEAMQATLELIRYALNQAQNL